MDSSVGSSAMKASGPSMSLDKAGAGGGVGNYKGVMLCNRPFAGSVAQKDKPGGNKKTTFICGLVPDAAGINVSMSSKDQKKVKRPKKETVLTKHRRWLADLQKTKDKLELQYIEEMKAKEAAREAFQKQEKQMRLLAKDISRENISDAKPETSSPPAEPKRESKSGPSAKEVARRPAWAQTAEVAEAVSEDNDLDVGDELGLLDFAQNLNFENVMGDIEVKSMMKKLKERIALLEADIKNDNQRDEEAAERAGKREALGIHGDSTAVSEEEFNEEEDLKELAKLVLDQDGTLGGVHSQASVESMLRQAKEKIATVAAVSDAKLNGTAPPSMGTVHGGPNIVVHEPADGTRVGDKGVSNLPYMHRNPAV